MAVNNGNFYPSALDIPFSFYPPTVHLSGNLPPGPSTKPPPLTVVSSANSRATRTTATVTPFSQSAASTVTVTSGNGGAGTNQALAATRTSSFAAALRKLAKQANDNGPDEISPRASPASTTRSSASTPSGKSFHIGPSPLVAPTSSPPVVTIAPTHTASSSLDSRRELERRSQSNSVDRTLGRSLPSEGVSSIWRGKDSPSLGPRRPLPQHPSKAEEMAGRGFQPYRAGEDIRPTATPHPLNAYDQAAMAASLSSYQFHPAFLTPANLQYPAFRPDEHFERYPTYPGLRPPFLHLGSPHAPLFPHPAMSPLFTGLRYPGELAAMQVPHLSPGSMSFGGLANSLGATEREKLLQEQQRERERERRAEELRQEQSRERSRPSERESAIHDRGRSEERRYSSSPARDSSTSRRPLSHSSSVSLGKPSPHEPGPVPLLKKADREDRWSDKHRNTPRSSRDEHNHETAVHYSQHRDSAAHEAAARIWSERERKAAAAYHERELILQQDRRTGERHEAEHRERVREEHHHPPPLTSLHSSSHDSHSKHNAYNNHRTIEYDRLPPTSLSRTMLSEKSSERIVDPRRAPPQVSKPASPLHLVSHEAEKESSARHGHSVPKNAAAAHMGPFDFTHPHMEFNRHFQEFYRNQHLREILPNHVTRPSSEPSISKLDLEEKRKREERSSGVYASSESESDTDEEMEEKRERYRRRMMRIARRSRLKMDRSEKKIGFFTHIGLATHRHRREIKEEQRRKRRRIYREESPTPPTKVAKVSPQPPLLPPAANLTQDDFQKEMNYPHKCRFLRTIGLDLLTTDKKQALSEAKKAVEEDRLRKNKRDFKEQDNSQPGSADAHSSAMDAVLKQRLTEGQKDGTQVPPYINSHPGLQTPLNHLKIDKSSSPTPSATSANHNTHSPSTDGNNQQLLQTARPTSSSSSPSIATNKHSEDGPLPPKKEIKQEVMNGEIGCKRRTGSEAVLKQPSLFTVSSFLNPSKHKPSTKEGFVQEFHESVLRSTQEALSQKAGHSLHVPHNDSSSSKRDVHTIPASSSSSSHRHHHHHHQPSSSSSSSSSLSSSMQHSRHHKPHGRSYNWPGWEVVSESYHRYLAEKQAERSLLLDHLARLKHQNMEVNSNAEQLARRKNELTERMYDLQREHESYMRELHMMRQRTMDLQKITK